MSWYLQASGICENTWFKKANDHFFTIMVKQAYDRVMQYNLPGNRSRWYSSYIGWQGHNENTRVSPTIDFYPVEPSDITNTSSASSTTWAGVGSLFTADIYVSNRLPEKNF